MEFNNEEYIEQLREEFEGKGHHQRQLEILGVNFDKLDERAEEELYRGTGCGAGTEKPVKTLTLEEWEKATPAHVPGFDTATRPLSVWDLRNIKEMMKVPPMTPEQEERVREQL